MKDSLRKFGFNLLLLTLLLTALGYGLFLFVIPESYYPLFPLVPFFVFAVTIIVHIFLVRASENNPRKFASRYLGAMGLKILIYIVFLIAFLILATRHAVPFLVSFLVCYASFTLVEVISILKYLKRK